VSDIAPAIAYLRERITEHTDRIAALEGSRAILIGCVELLERAEAPAANATPPRRPVADTTPQPPPGPALPGMGPGRHRDGIDRSALRRMLLDALEKHGPHGSGALAVICDSHKASVKNELDKMAGERLVHSVGLRRGQRWHLGPRTS